MNIVVLNCVAGCLDGTVLNGRDGRRGRARRRVGLARAYHAARFGVVALTDGCSDIGTLATFGNRYVCVVSRGAASTCKKNTQRT